jgi:hypothetical protein
LFLKRNKQLRAAFAKAARQKPIWKQMAKRYKKRAKNQKMR